MSRSGGLRRLVGMLNWIIKRKLAAFEKKYGYDISYGKALLEIDRSAMFVLRGAQGFSDYKKDIPRDVYYAGKLVSMMAEDCGPCTQLLVTMALQDGVDGKMIAAVIAGDESKLTEGQKLAIAFVRAARDHDIAADELRDQITAKWGPRAVVALSFAIVATKIYPTLKYAMGYGKACVRVKVGDEVVTRGAARATAAA